MTEPSTDRRRSRRLVLPDSALPTECDLVMKGGITSGIVYPRAVVEFARRFKLRSIGGASAGAIAAAAAAAAQYGKNGGSDRFAELEQLPEWLAGDGDARMTPLLSLFQPQPGLRPLYRWLLDGLSGDRYSRWRTAVCWLGAAVRRFPWQAAGAVLLVLAVQALYRVVADQSWLPGSVSALVCTVALLIVAAVIGGLLGVAIALMRKLPRHGFGICSGMRHERAAALTPWLHELIQRLAGRDADGAPLTFGDLWSGEHRPGTANPGSSSSARRDIDLRMMTTALSQGRPYSFPLEPGDRFYFDEGEFRALFPAQVVDWLLAYPGARCDPRVDLPDRCPLPAMADLPIIVAARMSLSFPLLIAAVPLYRCNPRTRQEEAIWFSDGGICSNFPVHYFDAPLPSRPTFAINLTDDLFLPRGREPVDPDDFVQVPRSNGDGQDHHIVALARRRDSGLLAFFNAIIQTLHNWSDNTQLRVPGFRDRVAHVRLRKDEGGLNLKMSRELILRLAERGRHAALQLIDGFLPRSAYQHDTTWQNHRWVRFRTSFTLIEETLVGLLRSHRRFQDQPTSIDALHGQAPSYSYRSKKRTQASREAYQRIIALAESLETLRGQQPAAPGGEPEPIFNPSPTPAPRPRSQQRIRPRM